jgi:hypothetical protein
MLASFPHHRRASLQASVRAPKVRFPLLSSSKQNLTHHDPPSYASFQISSGTGGTAQSEANAIFVDPFAGVDLATVSSTDLSNVQTMREAAESAETDQFNPQIDAATGDEQAALEVGKIKNKVLKLTVSLYVL